MGCCRRQSAFSRFRQHRHLHWSCFASYLPNCSWLSLFQAPKIQTIVIRPMHAPKFACGSKTANHSIQLAAHKLYSDFSDLTNMLDIQPIERQVMQMLLAGDHPTLKSLRQQFEHSCVTDRNFTGLGFFTSFEVRDDSARIEPPKRIVISDVCADVDGLEFGCGFVLFCLLYTSPSPRDQSGSRMPSSA